MDAYTESAISGSDSASSSHDKSSFSVFHFKSFYPIVIKPSLTHQVAVIPVRGPLNVKARSKHHADRFRTLEQPNAEYISHRSMEMVEFCPAASPMTEEFIYLFEILGTHLAI
jgi:hypothetical protein